MPELLLALGALWGISSVAIAVIFTFESVSHRRRSAALGPAEPVVIPAVVARFARAPMAT